MNQKQHHPFTDFVSEEQLFAFRAEDPSTWTGSSLVNAVLASIERQDRLARVRFVAEDLEMTPQKLSTAFSILTNGYSISKFLNKRRSILLRQVRSEHPFWTTTDIAKYFGLSDRGSLRRVLPRKEFLEAGKRVLVRDAMREFHDKLIEQIKNDKK